MKRFLAITIITLGFSLSLKAQEHTSRPPSPPKSTPAPIDPVDNSGWAHFTSEAGRFSVLMPEIPTDKTETVNSAHGPYTTHLFIVRDTTSVYLIGWVDYDPAFNFNRQAELEANRDNFVKGINGEASWWPIAVSAAMLPIFIAASWELLMRRRLLGAAERAALWIGRARLAASIQALAAALGFLSGSRAALARATALHVASFFANAAELWLTLLLMGIPAGFATAILLESLSAAARSAAFLIPSGWGAQEASLVALAAIAGLSVDSALALGLVKRARELGIGLPGLAAWGIAEHHRPSRLSC